MIIFLDIDGVVCLDGKTFNADCVEWLNRIVMMCNTIGSPVQIVFNTAWNIHPLDHMKDRLAKAKFKFPQTVYGQTDECGGGGNPIRRWLDANVPAGTPFLVLDDSTHHMEELWCRFARCYPKAGINHEVYEKACAIIQRNGKDRDAEILYAVHEMTTFALWVNKASWLTYADKAKYTQEYLGMAARFLADPDFLVKARLA